LNALSAAVSSRSSSGAQIASESSGFDIVR
jgi:hypothetical protein